MRPGLAVVCALAMVLAACSRGSDAGAGTTEPARSSVETTIERPPTTPHPTVATAPTTSPASIPVTDPTVALIAEIEADLNEGEQAFLSAGAEPSDPEARKLLERFFSGPSLQNLNTFLDSLVADGLRVVPNPDVPSELAVFAIEDVDDVGSPVAVVADICRVDAAIVVDPRGPGEPTIVNDDVATSVSRSRLAFVDGVWRLDGGEAIEDRPGVVTCDP